MPSSSPTHSADNAVAQGTLFVVATPIGNPDDITVRALGILKSVDLIAAEDTREIGKLLAHHHIHGRLVSYHNYNEQSRSKELIQRLRQGDSIALVSDAGTPSVSDPGYRLVREAVDRGLRVQPVPGVSAAITALSVSGLPTDSFVFIGFLAKKAGKRRQQLKELAAEDKTLIFYESPKRVVRLMEEVIDGCGNRQAVLCREMTKPYEEYLRGNLADIVDRLRARDAVKGECTLLVAGGGKEGPVPEESMDAAIEAALKEGRMKLSELARQISGRYRCPKKVVYDTALTIQRRLSEETDTP